jgi:HAE1 family hydrophobic/amphiphilic exporter-1
MVELSNAISRTEAGGSSIISRVDRRRAVTIFANLEGRTLGDAKNELDNIAGQVLTAGYAGTYKGQADMMGEAFTSLLFAAILGIIMAYMVLAAQFESFIYPFSIMLSLPMALIGAVLALLISGSSMSVVSMIGIIMLMGLVTKNAILLIDYANIQRERGLSRTEALLVAGPTRLRPILMTTFAMIFGMAPVALGLGEGSEFRSPMGQAVIGGLITSTILTLVVVPVVYTILDDFSFGGMVKVFSKVFFFTKKKKELPIEVEPVSNK